MRRFITFAMLALVLAVMVPLANAEETISGVYQILENGKIVGAERFNIVTESDGRIVTDSQGTMRRGEDETKDYTKLNMRTENGPIHSYQREVYLGQLGQGLAVSFADNELVIEASDGPKKQEHRLQVTPATLLVDQGVWHHLHLLLRRYSHRMGGEQRFSIAMPSELRLVDPVTLRLIGPEAVPLENGFFKANKYFYNRGDVGMIIWANPGGLILKVDSPMQGFVVELTKYDGERAEEVEPVKVLGGDLNYEPVQIDNRGTILMGVLSKPRALVGRLPAVLFLSDTGGHDREGNALASGIDTGSGALLDAVSLAGYAVLRVDDRGTGESQGDIAQNSLSVQAADADAMLAYLKSRDDIDTTRIAVIGWGEGANVAIMLAAQHPDLKAAVLIAPVDVSFEQLAREQLENRLRSEGREAPGAWERSPVGRMLALAKSEPERPTFVMGGRVVYLDVFREWANMHPVDDLKKSTARILHLQGGRDLQVPPAHAQGFRDAFHGEARYTFKEFAKLNHFLKPSSGTYGEYADPTAAIAPEARTYLTDWLKANL